jgi:hypothetical protein
MLITPLGEKTKVPFNLGSGTAIMRVPFRIVGEHRAVEVKYLDDWIDKVPLRTGKMGCNLLAQAERSIDME